MVRLFTVIGSSCIPVLLCITTSFSQVVREQQDRLNHFGSRVAALGDSYVSDAYDVSAAFVNPASILFIESKNILLDVHQDWKNMALQEGIAVPILTRGVWGLGISAGIRHAGVIKSESTVSGLSFLEYFLNVAASRLLANAFSFGIGGGITYGSVDGSNQLAFNASSGLLYAPSSGVTYGISYGASSRVIYEYDVAKIRTRLLRDSVSHNIQIGITMRLPIRTGPRSFSLSIASQKYIGVSGLDYRVGIEAYPLDFFALRVGYSIRDKAVSARYGAGIRFSFLEIDYMIAPSKSVNRFQAITFSFGLGNR